MGELEIYTQSKQAPLDGPGVTVPPTEESPLMQLAWRADYERAYARLDGAPEPRPVALAATVDLRPEALREVVPLADELLQKNAKIAA